MNNSHYLQTLYENVRSCGLVTSQYDCGHLCGRKDSWFSSAKSANRPTIIAAMITLAMSIERLPAEHIPTVGVLRSIAERFGITRVPGDVVIGREKLHVDIPITPQSF